MANLTKAKKAAAMIPPRIGETIQLAAIFDITIQSMATNPAAAIPAPMTPPTMEWVVETGAPISVARLTQTAAESSAASMAQMNMLLSVNESGLMMLLEMVDTTSPPAIRAPAASKTAAIIKAPNRDSAFDPTAGPMLLATSLAPMFIAM